MRKISLLFLTLLLLTIGIVGCQSKETNETNKDASDSQVYEEPTLTKFEQFEKGLNDKKITFEKNVMAAEMVGAVEGYKYKFVDGKIELYRFEKGSDALKQVTENKSVHLEGFGSFPVEINNNLAAIVDVSNNKDILMEIFNNIK